MKLITVHLENTPLIEMRDEDDTPLHDYTDKLAQVFQLSNVTILKTSHSAALIRPHKLTGLEVSEIDMEPEEDKKPVECVQPQESEDIITDAD